MNTTRMIPAAYSVSGVLLFSLFLTACGSNGNDHEKGLLRTPIAKLQLTQVEACKNLKSQVLQALIEEYTRIPDYRYACGGGDDFDLSPMPTPIADGGLREGDDSTQENSPVPDDVSDTNNQVAGVNEGDIVKAGSDGTLYILSGGNFIIAKGFPPTEMQKISTLEIGANGHALYFDEENQRVVIIARKDQPFDYYAPFPANMDSDLLPPSIPDEFRYLFYDVSNPSQPQLLTELSMQGYYQDGRRIKDRLHVISRYHNVFSELNQNTDFQQLRNDYWRAVGDAQCTVDGTRVDNIEDNPKVKEIKQAMATKIQEIYADFSGEEFLPVSKRITSDGSTLIKPLACENVYLSEVSKRFGLQLVSSVNTDGENLGSVAINNNSWITYASHDNLYLVENSYSWWWSNRQASQAALYKFSISDQAPEYMAMGLVDGTIRNQFSVSEYEGHLRVATTQDDRVLRNEAGTDFFERVLTNNLFVLKDDDAGKLNITGEWRSFGKDERIFSARFLGSRGFVVTFRQIDPLFTFDLSNAQSPQLMGEVTIPGFSTYMHPYDDNHLLTIGRSGDLSKVQLQLFDVSDLSQPVRIHAHELSSDWGYQSSEAAYEHKAFTFYKPRNLLAIPAQIYSGDITESFNGIIAFSVTIDKGFEELGRVDHINLAEQQFCDNTDPNFPPTYRCDNGYYIWWATPRRSIVMTEGDNAYLYTLSDAGLKAASTDDLDTNLGSIVFPYQAYPRWLEGIAVD